MTDRPTAPNDLDPLNIAAPPWWPAWEAWQAGRARDESPYVEGDPRKRLHDDLAYELAVMAFGDAYEALLEDLATKRSEYMMAQRVLTLRRQLAEYQERTRGR